MKKKQLSDLSTSQQSTKAKLLMTNLGTVTGLTLGVSGRNHESHGTRNRQ